MQVSHDERGATTVSYLEAVDVRRPDQVAALLERDDASNFAQMSSNEFTSNYSSMQVSHDERGGTTVSYLEGVDVRRPDRVASLLERAMKHRAVGATALNEQSSRSHLVFMLSIAGRHEASGQTISGETAAVEPQSRAATWPAAKPSPVSRLLLILPKPSILRSGIFILSIAGRHEARGQTISGETVLSCRSCETLPIRNTDCRQSACNSHPLPSKEMGLWTGKDSTERFPLQEKKAVRSGTAGAMKIQPSKRDLQAR